LSRRKRKVPGTTEWHSDKQRIELVQLYLATGNLALTAATLSIPEVTARRWKAQPWFKDMVDSFKIEENLILDARLKKVIEKSTDALLDRIENGDYQFDQKNGQMIRKPINARDASKVTVDMLARRDILQGKGGPTLDGAKKTIEKLALLAQEFARFANATEIKQIGGDVHGNQKV
jgi:hypothetical protein